MSNFETGIFDRVRLFSNILMLVLLAGNIFFSIQYVQNNKQLDDQAIALQQKSTERVQMAKFMKFFIDTVLNTKGTIAFEDRVKLENDIRQLHDSDLTAQWDKFVGSKDSKSAQEAVVKFMSMMSSKMI